MLVIIKVLTTKLMYGTELEKQTDCGWTGQML